MKSWKKVNRKRFTRFIDNLSPCHSLHGCYNPANKVTTSYWENRRGDRVARAFTKHGKVCYRIHTAKPLSAL